MKKSKRAYSKIEKLSTTFRVVLYFFATLNLTFLLLGIKIADFSQSFFIRYYAHIVLGCYGINVFLFYFNYLKFPLVRRIFIVLESLLFFYFIFNLEGSFFFLFIIFRQISRFLYTFSVSSQDVPFLLRYYNNPFYLVIITFLLMIFLGAVLLKLPMSVVEGDISLIDAFFTSTSAVCVTGLIVKDTYTYFTLFGQVVILILIQIGGLGIMTISTLFALIIGEKINSAGKSMVESVGGYLKGFSIGGIIRSVVILTFAIEFVGAILLYFSFRNLEYSYLKSGYFAVFHSISSFCNAGFSLYSGSFADIGLNWSIVFVVPTLIILGGLGFPCLINFWELIKSKNLQFNRLSLHSKIVVNTTVILLIGGTIFYYFSEVNSSMHHFDSLERIGHSFFQSVTTRTCGFNTIDQAKLSDSSFIWTLLFMLIGASPSSTGGGIKTTTLAIVTVAVISLLSGNKRITVFKRSIPLEKLNQVMALLAISMMALLIAIFFLFALEPFGFKEIIFEAVSAFGTVGLSMGITSSLSWAGKLVVTFLMFFGRIGPLTIIFALSDTKKGKAFLYPVENINIG